MDELLKAVKEHAYANYENGWDVLIECHSDAEIMEAIGGAKTVKGAIANVNRNLGIKVFASHRRDIEGEIF